MLPRRARYVRPITVAMMLPVALQPVDHLALLIEHLGELVGDQAADIPTSQEHPGVERRRSSGLSAALNRYQDRQAGVVMPTGPAEVGSSPRAANC